MHPGLIVAGILTTLATTGLAIAKARKPKSDPELTPELKLLVTKLVDDLDIAGVGSPQHKTPSAETIANAQAIALQLERTGYPLTANAVREMVKMSLGQ